jgi:hypothetical protein
MSPNRSLFTTMITSAALLSTACIDLVEIEVLRPAEIDVPEDIQTVIVIDRAAPLNFGEEVMSGVEGLGTAEGLLADREARQRAIQTVVEGLKASPRFHVVEAHVDTKDYGTSIWDVPMNSWEVIDLCATVQCDGVVSLDAFDSDTYIDERVEITEVEDEDGYTVEEIWFELSQETTSVSTWRVYDGFTGQVVDELRDHRVGESSYASGPTFEDAFRDLADARFIVRDLGHESAQHYVSRIAPVYETVYRHLYSTGSAAIVAGSDAFDAGDMDGAIEIWTQCSTSTLDEEKGRCLFNLAVSQEARGDLDAAYNNAVEAHRLLGDYRTNDYVRELASLKG